MKKYSFVVIVILFGIFISSCASKRNYFSSENYLKNYVRISDALKPYQGIHDTTFVRLLPFEGHFVLDMKYATTANFLNSKVYDCSACYLRMKTLRNLIEANYEFLQMGYRIKLFDCYRPLAIQKKMWQIMPNPDYVADPQKGSIHNRGGAVDITLVDSAGVELDMGTTFDHFGPEAAHAYKKVSKKVRANRALLKEIMLRHNFKSFKTEWWHYNLSESNKDSLANFMWKCD